MDSIVKLLQNAEDLPANSLINAEIQVLSIDFVSRQFSELLILFSMSLIIVTN